MPSIAVVNNKGGVGKTTLALNLAAAFARRKKKVLLVDLDGQGNASLALGIDPYRISPNSSDIFVKRTPVRRLRYEVVAEGFDICPAGPDLFDVDQLLATAPDKYILLEKALGGLPPYDYVIVDAPPALGLITGNTLVACNYFIVPMTADYLAYEALLAFIGAADRTLAQQGRAAKMLGIVFNQVDRRLKISQEIMSFTREHFGEQVFRTFIRSNARLQETPYYRKTIFQHDPNSDIAVSLEMLAGEVARRIQESA